MLTQVGMLHSEMNAMKKAITHSTISRSISQNLSTDRKSSGSTDSLFDKRSPSPQEITWSVSKHLADQRGETEETPLCHYHTGMKVMVYRNQERKWFLGEVVAVGPHLISVNCYQETVVPMQVSLQEIKPIYIGEAGGHSPSFDSEDESDSNELCWSIEKFQKVLISNNI